MASDESHTRAVGPYLLQKTLGKGQTGLVKLGVHCTTGKTVAVKIINREKLSKSVLMKVEREIAIMKLIDHPHVLGLYDVYENNMHLYLVLEHVSGGELFDYLVRKGRLSEREARRFFKQIVSAVDFCHKHSVCHRDLKPENLLLDDQRNIKVADFGMASLQVSGTLLETSCGSPHYACPEVIRGENYDGRKADVWSLGVILFALLVGSLPFDDDNLRVLLEKVKRGRFNIPAYVPAGAQELIRGMVDVNPKTRLTLDKVMRHSWFQGSFSLDGIIEPVLPMGEVVKTYPLTTRDDIDPDVFNGMTSLGCFRDKQKLISSLLATEHNEEKIIYFLLLDRKDKKPSLADEARVNVGEQRDPPRKRVDSQAVLPTSIQIQRTRSQSIGSAGLDVSTPPRSPRGTTSGAPSYTPPTGYYSYHSPQPNQRGGATRKVSMAGHECQTLPPTVASVSATGETGAQSPWKRRLSTTLKTIVSSPRFHRKRFDQDGSSEASGSSSSPQTAKRSWFSNFKVDRENEEVVVVYRDKTSSDLKQQLLKAFTVVNVSNQLIGDNIYKCKYEKSTEAETRGKPVLKKKVKFTVAIVPVQRRRGSTVSADMQTHSVYDGQTHSITFQQTSGSLRRFHRVCDKLQAAIAEEQGGSGRGGGVSGSPILMTDFIDSENRSGSSDDTLTLHSANGVSHDSGKGSSASVDIFVHRATNPIVASVEIGGSGKVMGGATRPSILDSSDSEDDVLDED